MQVGVLNSTRSACTCDNASRRWLDRRPSARRIPRREIVLGILAEQQAAEPQGELLLADASRPFDQKGGREIAPRHGSGESGAKGRVAVQREQMARRAHEAR